MIRIETIQNRAQLRDFVRFPLRIYTGDSPWVPPVWREEMMRLDQARGPFFKHSEAALFLARDTAGDPVGRIAAIRFNRHLEVYDDGVGFFGFFECINDEAAAGLPGPSAGGRRPVFDKRVEVTRAPLQGPKGRAQLRAAAAPVAVADGKNIA